MRTKMLAAPTNVVRFPVERRARPTLELMRRFAPSATDVAALPIGHALPARGPTAREQAELAAATRIFGDRAESVMSSDDLDQLIAPVIAEAIALCWSLQDATTAMVEAQHALLVARHTGEGWLDRLRARAASLTSRHAELLLAAHARVEAAEGIARAVAFARRGERWTPQAAAPEPVGMPGYKAVERARLAPDARRRSTPKSSRAERLETDKARDLTGAA